MEIPITISFKGNQAQLDKELFGLGEEITDTEILKLLPKEGKESIRKINDSVIITNGITLARQKTRQRITESMETGFVDHHYIIFGAEMLGLGKTAYEITNWFLNKIEKLNCKIKIDDNEVRTKEEFQKTLDEYIKSKQDNQ